LPRNAGLDRADLTGVDRLTKKQINEAIIDENTKLPYYLKESGHEQEVRQI
jgi:hypothetical protein